MPTPDHSPRTLRKVISAASAGTLIEWYDFYIFGSLAVTLADVYFPKGSGAAALLSTLATFAIGFVVRPFGALFFGYLGDLIGRKYTFMVTLLLMGGATFLIGVLPGYDSRGSWPGLGWGAPIILVVLRLLQGLALGGEYGGAATYVAEHAPDGKRGYWTSWIQTTATLGLVLSLAVILTCRSVLSREDFEAWGWRIPFWLSLILVIFSYVIRRKMKESPLFSKLKAEGRSSRNPFKESFASKANVRIVLLALFGATAGQGVVWYTGQFYALNFTKLTLGIDAVQAEYLVGFALIAATPFFVVFGALSDRIGRKRLMMLGCFLALVTYIPIYSAMRAVTNVHNPERFRLLVSEQEGTPKVETLSADREKELPARTVTSIIEKRVYADGTTDRVTITRTVPGQTVEKHAIRFRSLTSGPAWMLMGLVWVQVLYVTMVYGPIAAFLVELFPTRIRYSSMSLPYHIGNGVFGGMVPFIGQLLVVRTGNSLAGLWYPMAIAAMTLVIGMIFIREKREGVAWHEDT